MSEISTNGFESRIMNNEPGMVFGSIEEARAWAAAQEARMAADMAQANLDKMNSDEPE